METRRGVVGLLLLSCSFLFGVCLGAVTQRTIWNGAKKNSIEAYSNGNNKKKDKKLNSNNKKETQLA